MAGRGGFGGGGRGGAAGGRLSTAPMGMTTFQDVQAASKSQQARYPVSSLAVLIHNLNSH